MNKSIGFICISVVVYFLLCSCSNEDYTDDIPTGGPDSLQVAPVDTSQIDQVDTLDIFAEKMRIKLKTIVIKPDTYLETQEYPVVYMLHGHGGNYKTLLEFCPDLKKYASIYNIIFVCPEGSYSWYMDSPVKSESQYESFIVYDLVRAVDSLYRTRSNPLGRGIVGVSMGGYGALSLAICHKDVFASAGSIAGVVDLCYEPDSWNLSDILGNYKENKQCWIDRSIISLSQELKSNELNILLDCGTEDFCFDINYELHQNFLSRHIEHEYITRPGSHSYEYWKKVVPYHLLFFKRIFNQANN